MMADWRLAWTAELPEAGLALKLREITLNGTEV